MVQLRIVAFFGTRMFITAFTSATLHVVYLFHQIILIFKVISEHTDAFARSWHEFKNSFTLNVGLLSGDETWVHYFIPRKKEVGMQFGPLKHHYFGDRRLHNNDEVDIFVRELLRMEEPDLFCDVI
jgi:hypothetical protein